MDQFTKLAKQAVEEYVRAGKIIAPPQNLSADLSRRAGVFVTIYRGRELRGCIGTYLPTKRNIAEEIIANAIAASAKDPRFLPVAKEELPELSYEVSILSEPQPLEDFQKHNPQKQGIIARCADGRCGLLLPDLEGIDSVEQQRVIACQKGGIDPTRDKVDYFYFSVEKHR